LLSATILALNLPVNLVRAYTHWVAPTAQLARQQETALTTRKAFVNYQTLTLGSYAATVQANLQSVGDSIGYQFVTGRIYTTLGFFLFGLYAGRRRFFQQLEDRQALFGKFVLCALLALAGTRVATRLTHPSVWCCTTGPGIRQRPPWGRVRCAQRLHDPLIHRQPDAAFPASARAVGNGPPGRGWSHGADQLPNPDLGGFFGYGLGLLGNTEVWAASLLSVPIFLCQVCLSTQWLKHFRYGPVEWLWRSLTHGKALRVRAEQPSFAHSPGPIQSMASA